MNCRLVTGISVGTIIFSALIIGLIVYYTKSSNFNYDDFNLNKRFNTTGYPLRWVPMSDSNYSIDDAIIGGYRHNSPVYICRAKYEADLIIGTFIESENPSCLIPTIYGQPISYYKLQFDLLVGNSEHFSWENSQESPTGILIGGVTFDNETLAIGRHVNRKYISIGTIRLEKLYYPTYNRADNVSGINYNVLCAQDVLFG